MSENNNVFVDELLKGLFKPDFHRVEKDSLKELFERKIKNLNISNTNALEILNIQSRTLTGILKGTQKIIDYTNLIKIANFLQLPKEQVMLLYLDELEKNFPIDFIYPPEKIEFIKEHFDLSALKKAGFISSINEYAEIESRIITYFGYKSIFDYKNSNKDVAFSAGVIKPKNDLATNFWKKTAEDIFAALNNPYNYERQNLINYFPEIRWHSTDVELGLPNIIKNLYKIGITVIYQASLPSMHTRGATLSINNKPCIIITDYKGFYPTLWFALIHELYHVLFDWENLKDNTYHISDQNPEQLTIKEKDKEADNFAREYLFSKEKSKIIRPYLYDTNKVNEFAKDNHVHPSFIYVFNAYDLGKDRTAWGRATKRNPENFNTLIKLLENPWHKENNLRIEDFIKSIRYKLYN